MKTPLLAAAFLLLASCASPEDVARTENETAQIAAGRQLAETHCASCHTLAATGESHHPMAPPLRTLSRNYPVNMLEEAFAEGILVGHRDMPEFRLEPAQVDALVGYLESIQERRGA